MLKHSRLLLVVALTVASCLCAFAQPTVYKSVILDGKPSKLNVKTGVITTDDGKERPSYVARKTVESSKKESSIAVNDSLVRFPDIQNSEEKRSSTGLDATGIELVDQGVSTKTLESNNVIFHTVVEGETLYRLSKRYNVSLSALQKANNLETTHIRSGQSLRVSHLDVVDRNQNTIWTVVKGDTLYSIAKKNNITVARLKLLNHLEGNMIQVGQQLQIR